MCITTLEAFLPSLFLSWPKREGGRERKIIDFPESWSFSNKKISVHQPALAVGTQAPLIDAITVYHFANKIYTGRWFAISIDRSRNVTICLGNGLASRL